MTERKRPGRPKLSSTEPTEVISCRFIKSDLDAARRLALINGEDLAALIRRAVITENVRLAAEITARNK